MSKIKKTKKIKIPSKYCVHRIVGTSGMSKTLKGEPGKPSEGLHRECCTSVLCIEQGSII